MSGHHHDAGRPNAPECGPTTERRASDARTVGRTGGAALGQDRRPPEEPTR